MNQAPSLLRACKPKNPIRPLALRSYCHPLLSASYYSSAYPDDPPFPPEHNAILSQALTYVPKHGFTNQSLLLGARQAGYLDVSVQLFPRGAYDLVDYYRVTRRLALKDRVQFDDAKAKLGVGRKVRTLAWERLMMNSEDGVVGSLQQVSSHRKDHYPSTACERVLTFLAGAGSDFVFTS